MRNAVAAIALGLAAAGAMASMSGLPVGWIARHPAIAIELMLDPPPPPSAPMSQGAAWLFLHANAAATLLADPPGGRS